MLREGIRLLDIILSGYRENTGPDGANSAIIMMQLQILAPKALIKVRIRT